MQNTADTGITPGDVSLRGFQHAMNAAQTFATVKEMTQVSIANAMRNLPARPRAHKEFTGQFPGTRFGAPFPQGLIPGDWDLP